MLLRYFYFATPQFLYYIIPIAALIATLVVVGLLTRNNELIVIRACGVSLYRSALPLAMLGLALSVLLFELEEHVIARANRKAEAIRHVMRGFPPQTFGVLDRRWIVGADGDIYHYEHFDPQLGRFSRLSIFDLRLPAWRLASLTYAADVGFASQAAGDDRLSQWLGHQGWTRQFAPAERGETVADYARFSTEVLRLEDPSYFKTDEPDASRMTFDQLKRYIAQLKTSGFHVVPYLVRLQRKIAFPFVTLIMTLLAIPLAVTVGRSGTLYGIGLAVVLAFGYWTMLSVFGAVGEGGLVSPALAAWAPNILFGGAAAYMVLTVRT
jgi:LPS export ABC transporter permease LptG